MSVEMLSPDRYGLAMHPAADEMVHGAMGAFVMALNRPVLAKLAPPRTRHVVKRGRLFDLLDQHAALWLYGPPGSGKTTLVASYLEQQGLKPLWFQVDGDDREPSTFFHFLAEAKTAIASRRLVLPVAGSETRSDWPAFARRFARALVASLPTKSALVFDNVH